MRLNKSLNQLVPLDLPNFQAATGGDFVLQRSFAEVSATAWYREFTSEIQDAIGKRFLPIYRMADGEFIFCVGERMFRPHRARIDARLILRMLRGAGKSVFNKWLGESLVTCWGERYKAEDRARLLPDYINYLKRIAETGFLAIHFVEMQNRVFGKEYFDPMCEWLDDHDINLNARNYAPFYFVYALLAEANSNRLFAGLTVAVITHLSGNRQSSIEYGLLSLGAKNVIFLPISSSQAMTDRIVGLETCNRFDLALIGAGVGAVNILHQLEPTATVCIDAGFFLETLIDPSRRGERIFTRTDQEAESGGLVNVRKRAQESSASLLEQVRK